uniref:Putative chemosensory protein n=1 Tax=Sesamia inferens TaxID=492764 RepID=U5Q2S2_SESIF|nr:putative chemosensory protein [Sesamia inferens]
MKAVICLCALVVVAVARPEEQYTSKYDGTNIPEVLANQRLLHSYIKCGLDQGKCTTEGRELKSHLKEALETHCAKCTDKQKEATRLVIKHLINNEADYWKQLSDKYDPEGKYAKKYEDELKTVF